MIYFLCHPNGDRSQITVIDLAHAVSYERRDWANVNSDTFDTPEDAIAAGRDIATRHGLTYLPFESRYDSELNEGLR